MTPKQVAQYLDLLISTGSWQLALQPDGRAEILVPGCRLVITCNGTREAVQDVADKYRRGVAPPSRRKARYGHDIG